MPVNLPLSEDSTLGFVLWFTFQTSGQLCLFVCFGISWIIPAFLGSSSPNTNLLWPDLEAISLSQCK